MLGEIQGGYVAGYMDSREMITHLGGGHGSPTNFTTWGRSKYTESPQPWTVPLSISAIGKLAYVDKIKQDDERMKYMNWTGQLEIPIQVPEWLLENYGAFIDNDNDAFLLVLDIFRFSRTTII